MNYEKFPQNNNESEKDIESQIAAKKSEIKRIMTWGDITPEDRQLIEKLEEEIQELEQEKKTSENNPENDQSNISEGLGDFEDDEERSESMKLLDLSGYDISKIREGIESDEKLKQYYKQAKLELSSLSGEKKVKRIDAIRVTHAILSELNDEKSLERFEHIIDNAQ